MQQSYFWVYIQNNWKQDLKLREQKVIIIY